MNKDRLEHIELHYRMTEKIELVCSNAEFLVGSEQLSIETATVLITSLVSLIRLQHSTIVQNFERDLTTQDRIREAIDSIKK